MKLGFLTDGNPADVTFASETGYQCLEIALFGDSPLFDDPTPFQSAIANSGIELAAVSIFGQDYFSPEHGLNCQERLRKVIHLADTLGSPVVVFGSGASCPSVGAALELLAPEIHQAEAAGVIPAFYNCSWENTVDRPSAWAQLPEGFRVKFDPSHPMQGRRDWKAELLATGDRLVHAHAKDVLEVGGQFIADPNPGLGDIRWESFFGILNHLAYEGAVCVEPHSAIYTGSRRHEFLKLSYGYLSRFLR